MSHCVPSWDTLDDYPDRNPNPGYRKPDLRASSNSMSSHLDAPILDYAVAELTWKNGQLAMHGLGPPRVVNKPHATAATLTKYTWDKPRAAETLESIVNQATLPPNHKPQMHIYGAGDLVPWLDHQSSATAAGSFSASVTMTMDALVPSSNAQPPAASLRSGVGAGRCSTRVASCSGDQSGFVDQRIRGGGGGTAAATATHEWSSCRDQSASGSANFGMESSRQLTVETCERELGVKGFTSTSMGSPENTTSGKRSTKSTSPDEQDSVCHSKPQSNMEEKKKGKGKSSISTKRNKASMLDEVIEYLKQLQAQIHMMSRMNMSPMMMPLAMQQQQQIQMAMMNPMGMGIGMGIGMGMPGVMDLNAIGGNRSNIPGIPPVFHPATFMQTPMASWDMHTGGDRVTNPNDPMAAFLACQSQPMTMDAYSKMVALFQHMQNQPCYTGLKN
ncbi:hypothetical protein Ccrd_006776 [Cynara cardunculus var. scolymus]|uniref:Myc-type, basic helix-loop-helix (BHLH) domain-containing protein n=1 Tax=Cynara cardunculus var. scolymus TaxID=59895 RepID=A0A103XI80_CYNCS|nr:hypothetical protein Ccrd_006776 [Cynara cardunculus var. scolymus]